MTDLSANRLLTLAKKLLSATDFSELLNIARAEVQESVGYQHVWFMVMDHEDSDELRLIEYVGDRRDIVFETAPVLKIKGDRFLEETIASDVPVIIEDARTDPRTNKQIVATLQNRTIIKIPLRLLDKPFGLLGLGTFGDEGCRVPGVAEIEHLVGMAGQIAVAAGRIRFIEARMLAEREKLLLERRIMQMQKLESVGMLAGGIAHDFNNLLTVIISSAAFVEENATHPQLLEDVQTITGAAERARDLTKKLLAMSRQQGLELRPLDLNARLSDLLSLLRRVLPATIQVDLIKGMRLPLIEGDASQLDQVFMNLFINARDAMPDGGRLTIETEQVLVNGKYTESHPWAKPGRYTLVTVTDSGVGIAREMLDRIFDPFFSTKGPQAGVGLGLAVSYGIVRQHGGMLQCYSEPGLGTSFKVYLPALERQADSVGTKLKPNVQRAAGNERVLIADDDAGVRNIATRILERAGYRVTGVEDGDAASEIVNGEVFDLVVLDVVMPGMPCRQIVERIQTLRPETRILLSSGYTAGTNVVELLQRGGLHLLRKPYDPDEFLAAVRQALDGSEPFGEE